MIFTPINMLAHTPIVGILLLLASIAFGSYFRFVRNHLKTLIVIVVFLSINAVSSPIKHEAITGAFNVFKGLWVLPIAILASKSFTEKRFQLVAIPFSILCAAIVLSLLFSVVDWSEPYRSLATWSVSNVGNLHNLNNFLFTALILVAILAWKCRDLKTRTIGLISLPPILVACALVQSEGSLLALGCSALLLTGLSLRNNLGRALLVLPVVPVILLQFFYVLPSLLPNIPGIQAQTLNIRTEIYSRLLSTWAEHPVLGWGTATYKYVDKTAVDGYQFLYPHNLYLEALFSIGIAGCLLLSWWLLRNLRSIDFYSTTNSAAKSFTLALLVYLSIKGMSDMNLMSYHTIGLFAICFGLLIGDKYMARSARYTEGA